MTKREQFEEAFSDQVGSCWATCACGAVFYNSDGSWDWNKGELEALKAKANATDLDYSVGYLSFDGQTFVDACDCWWPRAERIGQWILAHQTRIAAYLKLEKKLRLEEANRIPDIGE